MDFAKAALAIAALSLFGGTARCAGDGEVEVEKARKQAQQFFLGEEAPDLAEAERLATALLADGSWPDIDYDNKARSGWPAAQHVRHALELAKAFRDPSADSSQQETFARAIDRALAFWRQHDFKSSNWFHNRITVPQALSQIALLLDDRLQGEDLEYLDRLVTTRCAVGKSTGQNRVWLASINLMHGLLRRNAERVTDAAAIIFNEAVISTGQEGIQQDYSFHQHGAQLQLGNYGLSFAADQVKWWTILRETRWAMPPAGREVIRNYLLHGQNWVVWRANTDISCCGRAFAPGVQASKAALLAAVMARMPALDPARADDYAAFLQRNRPGGTNDLTGCRHFWRSDYLVHRRKDFCVTLKMCSKRVTGSESLNGQNLSGYHLADGAAYFYRDGEEYKDIFPTWNWRMLPGVTCAQADGPMPPFGPYRLQSDFVGGVTDGENGCAVLDYSRDGVSARKSWFFLGDNVVCLGSGVSAGPELRAPVVTTLNQCRLRGEVRVSDGQKTRELAAGSHDLDGVSWIEHDGLRYTLLAPRRVHLASQVRTDNWSKVARTPRMPQRDVIEAVFSLSLNHGSRPVSEAYAYCISPARGADAPVPKVLSNTLRVQAVRLEPGLVGAVFHVPERLEYSAGCFAEVDAPCLLLLDSRGRSVKATVADPSQKLTGLSVTIGGRTSAALFPSGADAGKSVAVHEDAALPESPQ